LTAAIEPDVAGLLRAQGIAGEETPVKHNGFSGARISTIDSRGERFWLKRVRYDEDWIMQALDDRTCREAEFAVSPIVRRLPPSIAVPTLGAARDGDGWAILSRDIGSSLLAQDGRESAATCDQMLSALAEMHATFWDDPMTDANVSFSPWRPRLSFLEPVSFAGNAVAPDFGVLAGWQTFARIAPAETKKFLGRLQRDLTPLLAALEPLPRTLVHSDAKIANLGFEPNRIWMFDWAAVIHAPIAFEIGYMIAVNSSRYPWPHEETLGRYAAHLERTLGAARFDTADWATQSVLTLLIGFLYLGWAKAAQAESGDDTEFSWWCERALEAADLLPS
jgi:thiamine kinase-like enzyme